jgi:hypothetical protein
MPDLRPLILSVALISACANQANLQIDYGRAYFDRETRTLWLNGKEYAVPPNVATAAVTTGDKVRIQWEPDGDRRVVTRLEVTQYVFFGMR